MTTLGILRPPALTFEDNQLGFSLFYVLISVQLELLYHNTISHPIKAKTGLIFLAQVICCHQDGRQNLCK